MIPSNTLIPHYIANTDISSVTLYKGMTIAKVDLIEESHINSVTETCTQYKQTNNQQRDVTLQCFYHLFLQTVNRRNF